MNAKAKDERQSTSGRRMSGSHFVCLTVLPPPDSPITRDLEVESPSSSSSSATSPSPASKMRSGSQESGMHVKRGMREKLHPSFSPAKTEEEDIISFSLLPSCVQT